MCGIVIGGDFLLNSLVCFIFFERDCRSGSFRFNISIVLLLLL